MCNAYFIITKPRGKKKKAEGTLSTQKSCLQISSIDITCKLVRNEKSLGPSPDSLNKFGKHNARAHQGPGDMVPLQLLLPSANQEVLTQQSNFPSSTVRGGELGGSGEVGRISTLYLLFSIKPGPPNNKGKKKIKC